MRTRYSVPALALLIVLSAISGCKRVTTSVSTTGDIELTRYHTPVIYRLRRSSPQVASQ